MDGRDWPFQLIEGHVGLGGMTIHLVGCPRISAFTSVCWVLTFRVVRLSELAPAGGLVTQGQHDCLQRTSAANYINQCPIATHELMGPSTDLAQRAWEDSAAPVNVSLRVVRWSRRVADSACLKRTIRLSSPSKPIADS